MGSGARPFGNYELLAPLAQGGTAEIFLARLTAEAGFEKIVVVKQLLQHLAEDDEFVDMFLDEARLGAQMHHDNIVQTLELGRVGGRYFIAMEYVAGLTLAQTTTKALQRIPGGVPIPIAVHIAEQACAGLHYAHEVKLPDGTPLRIVHRDVSPQNLVITFEGEVKLVDFGIAHAAVREAKTKAGMIKGKFAYMSPEQCLGKPVDRRTDVFALGVVVYECLTGRRLFKRSTTYETYQAIIKGVVAPPAKVNPRIDRVLEGILLRALSYHPDDRFATAEEMGDALERWRMSLGLHVSSLDIARFYETYFQPELEEHRARMAQVLQGEGESDYETFSTTSSWGEELDKLPPVETEEDFAVTARGTEEKPPAHAFPLPAPEETAVVTPPAAPIRIVAPPVASEAATAVGVPPRAQERASTPVLMPLPGGEETPLPELTEPPPPVRRSAPIRVLPTPTPPPRPIARASERGRRVYVAIILISLAITAGALYLIYRMP